MKVYMERDEFRREVRAVRCFGQSVPEYMVEGLERYIFDGVIPDSFLCAVLKNDLVAAASRADLENMRSLVAWAAVLYNVLPPGSWGNFEAIENWVQARKAA